MLNEAAYLWGFGRATGRGFLGDVVPLRRQRLRAEFAARLGNQLAHPDLLGPLMLLVEILGAAFPAGSLSEPIPSAGLVSGALIEMRIDKGFGQRDPMAPAVFPVLRRRASISFMKRLIRLGHRQGGRTSRRELLTRSGRRVRRCSSFQPMKRSRALMWRAGALQAASASHWSPYSAT